MSKRSVSLSLRAVPTALALSLLLAGCADKAAVGASTIDVQADDTTCAVATTDLSTGSTTFNVVNNLSLIHI